MNVTRGKFNGFHGSWQSGLATLTFEHGDSVFVDNGSRLGGVLEELGAVITAGHCIDVTPIIGLELVYWLDDFGLTLGGFTTYENWLDAGLPELEEGIETDVNLEEYA